LPKMALLSPSPPRHPLAAQLPSDTTYEDYKIKLEGISRQDILEISNALRDEHGYRYEGFSDWTPGELAQKTDLSLEAAERASQRLATEPILWHDTTDHWEAFSTSLKAKHIRAIRGGRFIHLMGQTDKAHGMLQLVSYYRSLKPDISWTIVALGDSPNDIGMLLEADIGVVIPNPHRSEPLQVGGDHIIRAPHPGPLGWNDVISDLVQTYSKQDVRISKDG